MVNFYYAAAAAIAVLTCAVHVFAGGVFVVRPLLAAPRLGKASRWLNYYCWHNTTVTIAALAGCFAYAASHAAGQDLARLATILAASFALLSAAVALKGGINPLRFPSTSLFALTALFGFYGGMGA